jgi:hypothetical protein
MISPFLLALVDLGSAFPPRRVAGIDAAAIDRAITGNRFVPRELRSRSSRMPLMVTLRAIIARHDDAG